MTTIYQDYGMLHVGVEIEGFVYSKKGERINVYDWLGGQQEIPGGGLISTDAGVHQIEFSTEPCQTSAELIHKLNFCRNVLPKDWVIYWTGQDPLSNGIEPLWSPKPRYNGLHDGLSKEHPNWRQVLYIANFSALNVHLEIPPSSDVGVQAINWLNNQAPVLAKEMLQQVGIMPSQRFKLAWRGWADLRRLPHFVWFNNGQHLEEYWSEIPRLYHESRPNEWIADLVSKSQVGDPVAEGQIWWDARPRWSIGPHGTIEWRTLDSIPLEVIPRVVENLLERWRKIRDGHSFQRLSKEAWWQLVVD